MKKLSYYDQVEPYNKLGIIEPVSFWREYKHHLHEVGKESAYPRRSGRTYRELITLIRWCYLTNQDGYYFVHGGSYAKFLSNKIFDEILKGLELEEEVVHKSESRVYLCKKFLSKPDKLIKFTVLPVFLPPTGVKGVYALDHYLFDAKTEAGILDQRLLQWLVEIKTRLSPV